VEVVVRRVDYMRFQGIVHDDDAGGASARP
jgi:hypothetical protein